MSHGWISFKSKYRQLKLKIFVYLLHDINKSATLNKNHIGLVEDFVQPQWEPTQCGFDSE